MNVFWNVSIDDAKEWSTTHESLAVEDPIAPFTSWLVGRIYSNNAQQGWSLYTFASHML